MSESDDKKHDVRQLEEWRSRYQRIPGEPRLHHLDGDPDDYLLSAWHVRVGDAIAAPQVIATLETRSFTLDFEVFESGVLIEQCFSAGDLIPDGAVIARIAVSTGNPNP